MQDVHSHRLDDNTVQNLELGAHSLSEPQLRRHRVHHPLPVLHLDHQTGRNLNRVGILRRIQRLLELLTRLTPHGLWTPSSPRGAPTARLFPRLARTGFATRNRRSLRRPRIPALPRLGRLGLCIRRVLRLAVVALAEAALDPLLAQLLPLVLPSGFELPRRLRTCAIRLALAPDAADAGNAAVLRCPCFCVTAARPPHHGLGRGGWARHYNLEGVTVAVRHGHGSPGRFDGRQLVRRLPLLAAGAHILPRYDGHHRIWIRP
mmetsp:Transcript_30203/g.97474  ORF Transcript_30203/g.97474 Transcript_30203/m.97474 type:complete len:262 (-) Transcript_30203:2059-2844(-)